MRIKFRASQKFIEIKQIKTVFFKFINNNLEDKIENFNPYHTIENSINKKKFIIRNSKIDIIDNNNFYIENNKNNSNNNKKIKIIYDNVNSDDKSHNSFLKEDKNNEVNKNRNQKCYNNFNQNIKNNNKNKNIGNNEYMLLKEEFYNDNENDKNLSFIKNNKINDKRRSMPFRIKGNVNLFKNNNFPGNIINKNNFCISINRQCNQKYIMNNNNKYLINNPNNKDIFERNIINNKHNSLLNDIINNKNKKIIRKYQFVHLQIKYFFYYFYL